MMQVLNHLVARSIMDTSVVEAFNGGRIGDVLATMDFSPEMRARLVDLGASSFAEFAILAYRVVKAAEEPVETVQLPSPLDGLMPATRRRADGEQVA